MVRLWSWGHSSGLTTPNRTLVQLMNCCRRGGKQELINASFFALNHHVEWFLSTSGFLFLVQGRLPYLLCVPFFCGAASGQSAGHCCILCSGITDSSLRGVEPGRAVSMAVQRGRLCSLVLCCCFTGDWNLLQKNTIISARVQLNS